MFDAGLVDEVRRLLEVGLADGRTARTAIGYREVTAYLGGETTLDDAIESTTPRRGASRVVRTAGSARTPAWLDAVGRRGPA